MDYQKIIDYLNEKSAFSKALGIKIIEIKKDYAQCEMCPATIHENTVYVIHGGALFSLADVACSAAAATHGYKITTLSADFHFLSPANKESGTLVATANKIKFGRKISVYNVDVVDTKGKLIAKGTFSFYNLEEPFGS